MYTRYKDKKTEIIAKIIRKRGEVFNNLSIKIPKYINIKVMDKKIKTIPIIICNKFLFFISLLLYKRNIF